MQKKGVLIVVLVCITVILAGCASKPAAPAKSPTTVTTTTTKEEYIKIGALYNLVGGMASIDKPAANGVLLAAKEINEHGGILGKKIKVILLDTKTDQALAAADARRLIEEYHVCAIIGYGDTNYARAAGDVAQKYGVPFITSGATAPLLPKWVGDCMFLIPFGDNVQAAAMAQYATKKLGVKKVVIWVDVDCDYSRGVTTYFADAIKHFTGDKNAVVYVDVFHDNTKDFSTQIARLKAALSKERIDAIYIGAIPDDVGLIVKQIREAGIKIPILGEDGFDTPMLVKVAGKYANGVMFTTHVSLDNPPNARVKKFIEEYEKTYGHRPENAFAALGYDAMMVLAQAIKDAHSTNPQAIKKALEHIKDFPGVTGSISYAPNMHVPMKSVSIIKVENGSFITVAQFVPSYIPNPNLALNPIR